MKGIDELKTSKIDFHLLDIVIRGFRARGRRDRVAITSIIPSKRRNITDSLEKLVTFC